MNKLYRRIMKDIIQDARKERKENPDEPLFEIQEVSHQSVTVFDMLWDKFDPDGRFYTITNPDYMSKSFLQDKLIVCHSVEDSAYKVDTEALVDWLYENLPKEMWLTLNKIILIFDEDKDFEELYQNEHIGELLELQDLPAGKILGRAWESDDIVVVNIQSIVNCTLDMLANEEIFEYELTEDIDRNIATTLIHEIRHLAQNNPYLSDEMLNQVDTDEIDAESYARRFIYEHHWPILIAAA